MTPHFEFVKANLGSYCSRDLIRDATGRDRSSTEMLGSMRDPSLDPLYVDVTKPIYSAAMLAQHVIALQTELHRPKPL